MKKIILIAICLCLALMPTIPKVFAVDKTKVDQSIQNEPSQENVLMAGGFHGGFGHVPYHHHHDYYGHGPRVFACAPLLAEPF